MEIIAGLKASTSRGTTARIFSMLRARPSGRVLDAPAGAGALSRLMAQQGHAVVALDIDGRSFQPRDIPVVAADLNRPLPFPDATFDYAVCVDGIEHLENPFAMVREFRRVLKPGGEVFISTPNISSFRSRTRYLLTGFHNKGKKPLNESVPSPFQHISLVSFPELRYALCRAGFTLAAVSANRVTFATWPYVLLYPLAALFMAAAFHQEKDQAQKRINREIYRQMLTWPVALGETLVIAARKP